MELLGLFERINGIHFDGFLEPPDLRWNSRLRASAGRFVPGSRKYWLELPARIEIASYLLEEADPMELVADTMGHEMIHYWLWIRRRPYGHTPEFIAKMKEMGVSRYNTVPRARPYRYVYRCSSCAREFFARRRLGVMACLYCCRTYGNGKFDARFKLGLDRQLTPAEGLELWHQRNGAREVPERQA